MHQRNMRLSCQKQLCDEFRDKPSTAVSAKRETTVTRPPHDGDVRFDRLRYVEIKHGRISMLAVAGHLVQQNFRLPGMLSTSANLSFADMPNGVAALSKIPTLGLFQIVAFIGFLELGVMKQKEGSFAGDMTLGGEPYAWTKFSDEVKEQKRVSLLIVHAGIRPTTTVHRCC